MPDAPDTPDSLANSFSRLGYLVVPGLLPASVVTSINAAIDAHRAAHADEWVELSDSLAQTVDVLPGSADFDAAIENPRALELLTRIVGPSVALEEFSVMIRNPTTKLDEFKGWHRDIIRDYNRRMEINAVSLVYYLTDVGESDHCLSVIPRTHASRVDMKPEDIRAGDEVDMHGPAGTAVFFHARCLHTGKLKANSRPRRTLHIYFGPAELPRTSEWSRIPPRLYEKRDPSLPPKLYARWNETRVVEGTGKKPRDVDPTLSTAEMIRIVQQRAKVKARTR